MSLRGCCSERVCPFIADLRAIMIKQLQKFLTPPIIPDNQAEARRAVVVSNMTALAFISTLIYSVLWIIIVPQYSERLIFSAFALLITGIPFLLVRTRRVQLASAIFLIGTWLLVTLVTPSAGGTRSPFIGFYILIVTMAALIAGWRVAIGFAVLGLLAGAVMAVLGDLGLTPVPFATPWSAWLSHGTLFVMLTFNVYFLVRQSDQALQDAQRELAARRGARKSCETV